MDIFLFAPPGFPKFDAEYTLHGTPERKRAFRQWLSAASKAFERDYNSKSQTVNNAEITMLHERIRQLEDENAELRQAAIDARTNACEHCGKPIRGERSTKKYCLTTCRVAAHRSRQASA